MPTKNIVGTYLVYMIKKYRYNRLPATEKPVVFLFAILTAIGTLESIKF